MVRNSPEAKAKMEELLKKQAEDIAEGKAAQKRRETEIKVTLGDLSYVLCRVHNMLDHINRRTLWDIIKGRTSEDILNGRISAIKSDLIAILAKGTENGDKLNPATTPYSWQVDDIVKLLGGAK